MYFLVTSCLRDKAGKKRQSADVGGIPLLNNCHLVQVSPLDEYSLPHALGTTLEFPSFYFLITMVTSTNREVVMPQWGH